MQTLDGIARGLVVLIDELGQYLQPASEGKQDDIITVLGTINTSLTSSTNVEGGGKVAVGITPVEVTFTGTTTSVIISADLENTGTLYVGKASVASDGSNAIAFLAPGESLTIEYTDTVNALYVVSDTAAQNFWKGATL